MILGFKDRFVPLVESGLKTHTIRAGNRWKAGLIADCFARPRQKGMRLILRAPVVKVERIRIFEYGSVQSGKGPIPPLAGNHVRNACRGPHGEALLVEIDGTLLEHDEAEALFRRDGFTDPGLMASYEALLFWKNNLPFTGQIIHWGRDLWGTK